MKEGISGANRLSGGVREHEHGRSSRLESLKKDEAAKKQKIAELKQTVESLSVAGPYPGPASSERLIDAEQALANLESEAHALLTEIAMLEDQETNPGDSPYVRQA